MLRLIIVLSLVFGLSAAAQEAALVLVPDRVFDGFSEGAVDGIAVRVSGGRIAAIGAVDEIRQPGDQLVDLAGMTLLPGLIELHSHVLLHPYDETAWNDQVLKESWAERALRAGVHLERTLRSGFTTIRDLGSEGAGYTDVGLRQALEKGVIQGPRLLVSGPAIVATGSYGPKGFAPHVSVPLGAEPADGADLVRVVRSQIGGGVDWVKVYADYRWGPNGEARPTFSLKELTLIVDTARSSGRPTVAHASTAEGMRRAALAGVATIEHGDQATVEIFELMVERDIAWCPTLGAGEAISQYGGWQKGIDPDPSRVAQKKRVFGLALAAGVVICLGSDVGVFDHGDSAWEAELMVEYGMTAPAVLRSATSLNASLINMGDELGRIAPGYIADLIAVAGDPTEDISALGEVRMVMQNGRLVR